MSVQTTPMTIERNIHLSPERAHRLHRLAAVRGISEDLVVERALDILFSLTDIAGERSEQEGWSLLSEGALQRVWNNDADAAYDNWREIYGVPTR